MSNGVQGGNEFTIDGAPNLSNARGVGFFRRSDAIRSSRSRPTRSTRSVGPHGGRGREPRVEERHERAAPAGGYFNRDSSRTETPLLTMRAGGDKPTRESLTASRARRRAAHPQQRRSSWCRSSTCATCSPSCPRSPVPTAKMRAGDMSEFDPHLRSETPRPTSTARSRALRSRTTRFRRIASTRWPRPTRRISGAEPSGPDRELLHEHAAALRLQRLLGRVDHNITGTTRIFVNGYVNKRREDRYNWAQDAPNGTNGGVINDFAGRRATTHRSNLGFTGGSRRAPAQTVFDARQLHEVRRH